REDGVEAFLVGAQVEWKRGEVADDPAAPKAAAQQNLAWLDRAEKYLPGTRILAKRRAQYRQALGQPDVPEGGSSTRVAASAGDRFSSGVDARTAGATAKAPSGVQAKQQQYPAPLTRDTAPPTTRPH